ncbi:MAG: hypothetical protein AAGG48_22545 [Planctomycetota bacterium]
MEEPVTVKIEVVESTGDPSPGAFVSLEESSVPFPEMMLVSNEDGHSSVFLDEGKYRFRAQKDDRIGHGEIEVVKSSTKCRLQIRLGQRPESPD